MFNKLSAAEHERLAYLAEELAESIHIVGKILRHGFEASHPDGNPWITNRYQLEKELGHVLYALDLLGKAGDINAEAVVSSTKDKSNSKHYFHHQ